MLEVLLKKRLENDEYISFRVYNVQNVPFGALKHSRDEFEASTSKRKGEKDYR